MIFHRGDRVRVKHRPNGKEVTGRIKDSKYQATIFGFSEHQYLVEFDEEMIPKEMFYPGESLELLYKGSSCQCGAKFTSFPEQHMIYCPQFKND